MAVIINLEFFPELMGFHKKYPNSPIPYYYIIKCYWNMRDLKEMVKWSFKPYENVLKIKGDLTLAKEYAYKPYEIEFIRVLYNDIVANIAYSKISKISNPEILLEELLKMHKKIFTLKSKLQTHFKTGLVNSFLKNFI